MRPRDSLSRRIALAFLLFACVATLFFAFIAALAVEGIEERLVDDRLEEVALWASPRFASGYPVAMPAGLSFHHGSAIPAALRGLPPGVQEISVDGVGLHVLSGKDPAGDYVVVDHESDYEKVEIVVYSLFAAASLGSILLALFLGRYFASRVVTPILELTSAVDQGAGDLPLSLLNGNDELGTLARAFDAHTSELRSFLDRERFFTGDVSHELRTPLTVISGAAEILVDQFGDQPQIAAPAQRILRAAGEASERINVLLMLARTRERVPHPGVSIEAITQAEVARYQPLAEGKPVLLAYHGGTDFTVAAPAELCAALIGNLIRNACQYTEAGSVDVHLGEYSVTVADSGPGLPPGALATLAGAGPAQREGPSSGAGLGLALVRRICEHLGARLAVQAREGGGSVFTVRFDRDLTKI
jgi:signal transduction histidine kinase